MTILIFIVAIITLLGLYNFLRGLGRLARRQPVRATMQSGTGALFLGISALAWGLGSNLLTYQRLTYEQSVAELQFQKLEDQRFKAQVNFPSGKTSTFLLQGDEWQMDARVLKWKSWATMMGLDASYRLDRISGRYRQLEQARSRKPSVFALAPQTGLDVWQWSKKYSWLNLIDTHYGSAAYMPMKNGANYQVQLTQSGGLLVRPTNDTARTAVKNWHLP